VPRLMKGMFKRGSSFCTRLRQGGRDRWISLGSDYQGACRQLRAIRREGSVPAEQVTVEVAAKRWLASYIATRRNEKGRSLAERRVKSLLVRFMGRVKVSSVTREDIRAYRLWLERGGSGRAYEPQTVAHILSDARCLFYWAADEGLIDRAPVPRRLLPRIQERPPDRLTDDEVEKTLRVPEPYGFIVRVLLGTGLRWGELIRAKADDIENGCLVLSQTKSGRVRRVPLAPDLLAEIRTRIGRLVHYGPKSSGAFATTIQKLSGVKKFHAHRLRHTFACRWIERGGSLAALQQILGHSTVVTTQRYARIADDVVAREAERIYSQAR
jgi:integrase